MEVPLDKVAADVSPQVHYPNGSGVLYEGYNVNFMCTYIASGQTFLRIITHEGRTFDVPESQWSGRVISFHLVVNDVS